MIGKRLRYLRDLFGYKQSYVEQETRIDQTRQSRLEKGIFKPYWFEVIRLARLYGCSLDYMASEGPLEPPPGFKK